MSAPPLIGVTTSITIGTSPERAYVNSAYLHAVQQAGGVPVPLPPQLSAASFARLGRGLDGLLLTGGGDLDPALFGEAPHPTVYEVAPARDALEASAVRLALERGLPILAVCRGIQLLNVALGGSLFQDVGSDPGTQLRHSQPEPRDQPTHKVKLDPRSRLADTLGTDELEVNSMHHQAVKALGAGLTAVAWAPDQIVEGVESADRSRFVLGVQWHPEELCRHSEPARRLFEALVRSARP
ncbi:MAG TPA: gamma-glutamyl-gamma-aminobutyrate hydrolase family protein [Candidatus Methylomirabilis sp.]|nr:gamma-glutamyl-gamma-aminobutyrate hydrolase family protein [Candidatus Methylomirabilis sp.]